MDRTVQLVCLGCCAVAAAGCDRSTAAPSPSPPARAAFDAAAVDSELALVSRAFGAAAIGSLSALGPLTTIGVSPPVAPSATLRAACAPAAAVTRAATATASARQAEALIPDSLFRRVFTYDTAARAYRVSPDTSGPPGGIRFVLYALNSYGLPTLPLASDGTLDLIDQSSGSVLQVRSQIADGAAPIADFVVRLSGTQAADTARLTGAVTDGASRLTFRDSTASAGFGEAMVAHLADSIEGLTLDFTASRVSFDPFDYNDDLDVTLTGSAGSLRATGTIRTYCLLPSIGLSVALNGTAFASVTNGTTATPHVARVDGQPITAAEAQAILDLKDAQQRLFAWLGAFAGPARGLLPRN